MMTSFNGFSLSLPLDSSAARGDATRKARECNTDARAYARGMFCWEYAPSPKLASSRRMGDNATAFRFPEEETLTRAPGTYAVFETSQGTIVCRLFEKEAPQTVANFVGLAEGTKEFKDSRTGQKVKRPFYDGLSFHRVIPKFMIQGGCPLGTGTGDPGYRFADEFHPSLRHDKAGKLSMANAGPNTNGSQFFLTVAPTPWLDNKHAIFGEIVEGLDLAIKISELPRGANDKPKEAVTLKSLWIERV
jgi:peptidyl-prolyl cis-trans isomerase A (cyclophilin A)